MHWYTCIPHYWHMPLNNCLPHFLHIYVTLHFYCRVHIAGCQVVGLVEKVGKSRIFSEKLGKRRTFYLSKVRKSSTFRSFFFITFQYYRSLYNPFFLLFLLKFQNHTQIIPEIMFFNMASTYCWIILIIVKCKVCYKFSLL